MISRKELFVIVEGRRLDRVFYDSLLNANRRAARVGYEVVLCEEVWPGAGGKESALQIFQDLRRRGRLQQQTRTRSHLIAFALDSDFDSVLARRKRSHHLFYTEACDVEAEVFINGDLTRALALSLSITNTDASTLANSLSGFVEDLANTWREWITLCCVALGMRSRCSVHPSKRSLVNRDAYGQLDTAKLAAAIAEVRATCGINANPAIEPWIRARVDGVYRRGQHRLLVKGKNLPTYLTWRLTPLITHTIVDSAHFRTLITHSMLHTLDFESDWASKFHTQIDELLDARG